MGGDGVGPHVLLEDQEVAREKAAISGVWSAFRGQKPVHIPRLNGYSPLPSLGQCTPQREPRTRFRFTWQ